MRSSEMPIFPFTRRESEVESLRVICRAWQNLEARFWSFDDVLGAVTRNGSLVYFAAETQDHPWEGVILADTGPFTTDLLYVFVAPAARQNGLAKRLMKTLIDELEKRPQMEALLLEVRASNVAAQALYRSLGLSYISRRARYYSDGEDALIFRRALNERHQ